MITVNNEAPRQHAADVAAVQSLVEDGCVSGVIALDTADAAILAAMDDPPITPDDASVHLTSAGLTGKLFVANMANLTELTLTGNSFGSNAPHVNTCKVLKTLYLTDCGLSAAGVDELIADLSATTVEEGDLNLTGNSAPSDTESFETLYWLVTTRTWDIDVEDPVSVQGSTGGEGGPAAQKYEWDDDTAAWQGKEDDYYIYNDGGTWKLTGPGGTWVKDNPQATMLGDYKLAGHTTITISAAS